jgi:hypothetical protein
MATSSRLQCQKTSFSWGNTRICERHLLVGLWKVLHKRESARGREIVTQTLCCQTASAPLVPTLDIDL